MVECFKEEKEESEKFQINRKRQREKVYGQKNLERQNEKRRKRLSKLDGMLCARCNEI